MAKIKFDLYGKKFNYWRVIKPAFISKKHGVYWYCECEICKNLYAIRRDSLMSGNSTMCKQCSYGRRRKRGAI